MATRAPSSESRDDARKRHAMISKLFHLFPGNWTTETLHGRIVAVESELLDIHVDVLGLALRRLVRDSKRPQFLPTVAEIRRSAAWVVRAMRGGRSPDAPESSEPAVEPDVERYLAAAPKPGQPLSYLQLASGAPNRLTGGDAA